VESSSPATADPRRCWPRSSITAAKPFGVAQYGTVYTTGTKIAEHGGDNPQDRNVPILVSGPSAPHDPMNTSPVETTQIAPTILDLLGLNPHQLQAVRQQGTASLPGL
jgi:phosphoglycerol transferase MdoB-like AlkP superfamily enzyme